MRKSFQVFNIEMIDAAFQIEKYFFWISHMILQEKLEQTF